MGVGPSQRSEWSSADFRSFFRSFCRKCVTIAELLEMTNCQLEGPMEELGIKRRRLRESLLRVIQSESQEDSNHSDQARQAQYLDTVHEVFGRIL